MEIRNITPQDLHAIQRFTDEFIGLGYFSLDKLEEIYQLSCNSGKCASFIAVEKSEILGVRLTFAPGRWIENTHCLTTNKWNVSKENVGYFKSLFVHSKTQGQGVGKTLSNQAIKALKSMGAEAIVCHSWLESPGNSSQKYLTKMGFESVQNHPMFWSKVDYKCVYCGDGTCQCTADEMILYI